MYVSNCIRSNIAFAVNLLARHSAAPTKHHWMGVRNIFIYFQGITDLDLFYQFDQNKSIIGYTDLGYQSDPHNIRSQIGFLCLHGGTSISWKSSKQTLISIPIH